jgi:hypothetical protein
MVIATITAILFLFGGGAFSLGVFKDAAKEVIQDKNRVQQIEVITKQGDKEIKLLGKDIEERSKVLVAMEKDYDLKRDELDAFLAQSDSRREQVQDRLIELRFQAKELVTEEEWKAMYAHVDKEKRK